MVDGELWSRFFLHDELYTVDCVLGGWRWYGENRALKNYQICLQEMEECIAKMASNCDTKTLSNASRLGTLLKASKFAPLRKTIGISATQKILGRTVANGLFQETGYKLIIWDVGKADWTESTLPFRNWHH